MTIDQSTWCYITEDSSLCSHHCENIKSQIQLLLWKNNSWWKWTSFSKYSTFFFFSDGKVACLKTECPAVETVCDREMTAVAVPGKEDDCCQKYICGMYLNSVAQKIHKVSLSPGPDIDRPYVHIGPFSQFGNCKCVVKILLIIMYAWGCDFLSLIIMCFFWLWHLKTNESKYVCFLSDSLNDWRWKMRKLINGQTCPLYKAFVLCILYNILKIQLCCAVDLMCFWLSHSVK